MSGPSRSSRESVSHYRLIRRIGAGGMGVVWEAIDTTLDRTVAIKFLPEDVALNKRRLAMFKKEARAVAALNHPNIVTIHSVEEADGVPFITMEFVRGASLDKIIPPDGLPLREFFGLAIPLAEGLNASHERGITHRDLKPSNVMVSEDGRPKIVDFGLAKLRRRIPDDGNSKATTATVEGSIAGTIPFMAPEQLHGKEVDARSDIFSLGVLLYQMCTGESPFRGDSSADLVASILRSEPLPPTQINSAVPRQLERIIVRCLRKDPTKRFQTARDICNELDELQQEMSPRDGGLPAAHPAPLVFDSEKRKRSIAVLPLRNLSADPESEYLSDGMTQELIDSLARVKGLRVVSRTSAFALKDKALSVREIGDHLGVGLVVEGTVHAIGSRVRVTIQLAEASDGYQLWSEKYDRKLTDVFAIQDEIGQSIVETLTEKLAERHELPLVRHYTQNLEAYTLYLKGRYYWHQETGEALEQAIQHFERALKEDPEYAPAHAGVADYYVMLAFWGIARPADVWPQAREAAVRALKLDSALAEAHVSLGLVRLFFDWDSEAADREFLQALKLNPSSADTHYSRTLVLAQTGCMTAALDEISRARDLDPLSPILASTEGWVRYYARQYDEAIKASRQALELESDFLEARIGLGVAYKEKREFDRAIEQLSKAKDLSDGNPLVLGALGATLAAAGRTDEARSLIQELDAKPEGQYVAPVAYAMLYAGLNEARAAIEFLGKACEARDGLVRYLNVFPIFDSVREQPGFHELLHKLNLTGETTKEGGSSA